MPAMVDPVIVRLTKRLRRIAREMDKYSRYIQDHYDITVPQLVCLQEIYQHGPLPLGVLTRIMSLNNSTVTGIVDRLEKRQLVRRLRMSKDRRRIHVEITSSGVQFIDQAPAPLQRRFVDRLQALSEDEIEDILAAVERLILLFESDDEPAEPLEPLAAALSSKKSSSTA